MAHSTYHNQIIDQRHELHRYPEEGWTEFWTTAYIAKYLRGLGIEVLMGEKVISREDCLGRNPQLVAAGIEAAKAKGVCECLLNEMQELTGCVAVLDTGRPGPTVALRFDIDCVNVLESTDPNHLPAKEGWRSERDGLMHACGHDAHAATGMAICRWAKDHIDQLNGKLKVVFQPAEEGVRGASAVAASGVLDDCDYFLTSHVSLMAKSGEVLASPINFLSTTKYDVTFTGRPAHAGIEPNAGRNALAAACHAVTQLLGISRHGGGMTRINIGRLVAGEGRNVIPVNAKLVMEVRGETGEINQYMSDETENIVQGVAKSFGVDYKIEKMGAAVDLVNDAPLVAMLDEVLANTEGVTTVMHDVNYGGSEDATILAKRIQSHGGQACYFVMGGTRPAGGHHTASFDFDESTLATGFEVYVGMIKKLMG
ncbi:MAG: amidohydrolase [Burkholderiaceae bacterium]|nr:amidohydrolase [Burkholderiaceae bacterium]